MRKPTAMVATVALLAVAFGGVMRTAAAGSSPARLALGPAVMRPAESSKGEAG